MQEPQQINFGEKRPQAYLLEVSWSLLQAQLVQQIGAMLTSFTQRKTQEVSQTVAGLHSQLDTGRTAIGTSFAELNNLSTAASRHVQVRSCV